MFVIKKRDARIYKLRQGGSTSVIGDQHRIENQVCMFAERLAASVGWRSAADFDFRYAKITHLFRGLGGARR